MNHHDTRITTYLQRNPDVKTGYVASIFNVEPSHVSALRKRSGCYGTRKKAALARGVTTEELDEKVLAAVYRRGLVEMVLADGS